VGRVSVGDDTSFKKFHFDMAGYSEADLHEIFCKRLSNIDDTPDTIWGLGIYSRMIAPHYDIFIDALDSVFTEASSDLARQLCYIHLMNEILCGAKDQRYVINLFTPLLERMMVKAAEARDPEFIRSARYVIDVLGHSNVLDSSYVTRVVDRMNARMSTGPDEDAAASDQFSQLSHKLVRAKHNRQTAIESGANETEIAKLVRDEKKIRDAITAFHCSQMNTQGNKMRELDKLLGVEKQPRHELLSRIIGSDDDDDDDV
jgi:hypothetical protein